MKKEGNKGFVKGLITGVLIIIILAVLFYNFIGIKKSGDKILVGKEEVVFNLKDVYKTVDKDFLGGTVPVYDNNFCMKKYTEKYNKQIEQCEIRSIRTLARSNPLVIDVNCVCFE